MGTVDIAKAYTGVLAELQVLVALEAGYHFSEEGGASNRGGGNRDTCLHQMNI